MPYKKFEQNKKLKRNKKLHSLSSAVTALDHAVRDLQSPDGAVGVKTLQRRAQTLRFVDRSRKSGEFSAQELSMIQKAMRVNIGKLRGLQSQVVDLLATGSSDRPSIQDRS